MLGSFQVKGAELTAQLGNGKLSVAKHSTGVLPPGRKMGRGAGRASQASVEKLLLTLQEKRDDWGGRHITIVHFSHFLSGVGHFQRALILMILVYYAPSQVESTL